MTYLTKSVMTEWLTVGSGWLPVRRLGGQRRLVREADVRLPLRHERRDELLVHNLDQRRTPDRRVRLGVLRRPVDARDHALGGVVLHLVQRRHDLGLRE